MRCKPAVHRQFSISLPALPALVWAFFIQYNFKRVNLNIPQMKSTARQCIRVIKPAPVVQRGRGTWTQAPERSQALPLGPLA